MKQRDASMGRQSFGKELIAVAAVLALGGIARAATWDGGTGGTGNVWETATNWAGDVKPSASETAEFTDLGLTQGKTINLGQTGQSQVIQKLLFNTATGFTLASGGNGLNTLTVTDVQRLDVAGTENIHTISTGVVLGGDSTWDIAGENYLSVTGAITDGGAGRGLAKNGAGELRLASSVNNFAGVTTINAGTIRYLNASQQTIKNAVVVGNGVNDAALVLDTGSNAQAFQFFATLTVNAKGMATFLANGSSSIETLVVNGGTIDLNGGSLGLANNNSGGAAIQSLAMTGGLIRNGTLSNNNFNDSLITINPSAETAVISAALSVSGSPQRIQVADGAAVIDFRLSGANNSGVALNKLGAGVMELTGVGTNTSSTSAMTVTAGTVLVNNPDGTANGIGRRPVNVLAGATLGGTGYIGGGDTTSTTANVNLTGTSAAARAVLSPGTLDNDGTSTIESLTVGSAVQANSVTFNAFTTLLAQIGSAGSADLLQINGALNLATTSDALQIETLGVAGVTGEHVLATFTGLLTGRFDAVTLSGLPLPSGVVLQYRDASGNTVTGTANYTGGSIVLVPEPSMIGLAALAGLGVLRRRTTSN